MILDEDLSSIVFKPSLILNKNDISWVYFYGASWNDDFGVTSTKPSVASPLVTPMQEVKEYAEDEYFPCYARIGDMYYNLYYQLIKSDAVGSATIKVFTNDGTNLSTTFSVRVVN
jgi:hypothetical protein